jgi:pyruvate dehydrogenase E2 component (dihydrolipoamide acetyltransferase)
MSLQKLTMPKWGLNMREGELVAWLVEEGRELALGDEVAEVETEKINGVVESPAAGVLRRRVAEVGQVIPVGGLLGVLADASISDGEIDAFVAEFASTFVPEEDTDEGLAAETVTVGGRTIRYVRSGAGTETVVLIHGFGGDLTTWLFNQEALAATRTVIALDLPGHGGSSKDVGSGSLEELAGAVADALDAIGVERAHLVGHSLGGAIAATVSTATPSLAASLVLIASTGLGSEINADFLEGFVAAESRRELRPVLELLFADPDVVTRQFTDEVLKTKRLDGVDDALRAIADACFPGGRQAIDIRPALAGTEVPTLVLWGAEDRIVPSTHATALASAPAEVIPGAGHQPQMEAAGEVNRLIGEFVEAARS